MNLLFDLDGTLTDPFPGITRCIAYALERVGVPAPQAELLRWCIGPPLKHSLAKLLATEDTAPVEEALAFYRERFGKVGLFENEVYDGIPEVLEALNEAGHTLVVATSKPAVFARRIVDHFGLQRYFKQTYGSELDGTRVDKTSLIAHILEEEAIDVTQSVMIGDRAYDMIGGQENGLSRCGVLWGYGSQEELERSGAQTLVATPSELIPAICRRASFGRPSDE
jgi:phosphoglycolate phosphatase